MIEEEKRQFYAQKGKAPTTVNMGGKKVAFASFPESMQKEIKERLAKKDPVMKKALETTEFGIKINGIEITRGNIHQFEIKEMVKIPKAEPVIEAKSEPEPIVEPAIKIKKEPVIKKVIKAIKPKKGGKK